LAREREVDERDSGPDDRERREPAVRERDRRQRNAGAERDERDDERHPAPVLVGLGAPRSARRQALLDPLDK
jgi:hypothetical protein